MGPIGIGTVRVTDDPDMEFRLSCPNCKRFVPTPTKAEALVTIGNNEMVRFYCVDCGLYFFIHEENYDWFARYMAFYKKGTGQ